MADGSDFHFLSLPSLGSISLTGSEGHLSFGDDNPEFVSETDRLRFQCPVHKGLLHDTVQTTCGHRLCRVCVGLWLNGAASKRCPVGEPDCEDISEANVNRDRSIQRDLQVVLVFCKNKHEGCPQKMPFKNYRSHLDECEFHRVACQFERRGCKEKPLRRQLKEHQEKCPFRPVPCQLCHQEISHCQMQDHDDNLCEEKVTGCPFGCDNKSLKRKEVKDHRDACPMQPSDCSYKKVGCKYVGKKEAMEKHEKEGLAQHMELTATFAAQLQQSSMDAQEQLRNLSADREELGHRLQLTLTQDERTSEKIRDLETQVTTLKLKLVTTLEKAITVERKIPELVGRFDAVEQNVEGIQRRITQLEQRRERDQQQSGPGSGAVTTGGSTQVARFGTVDNMAETTSNQLSGHEQQLQLHGVRMAEMDLRFQLLETASYDGTLIWKIKDYAQRKRDAVNARTLSLYSQPFYSHRFGYKMCARVYLNGDGIGKTTHLSLFFVVMRGEYDALLQWPFRQKVTLTLLDQSAEKRHLIDHFQPDPNSSSFRKPVSEMNVASGCPMFVSHGVLESEDNGYLKDDTIFIRIVVDPNPNPTTL